MKDFTHLHQPTGRLISDEDRTYLFFGGTSYLGLLVNEAYIDVYKQGISIYGLNNGTSRNNNIQLGIFDIAEEAAALRFGFEDAMLVSSGYLAAQLVVRVLALHGTLLYAPNSHPALWFDVNPGVSGLMDSWLRDVVKHINASKEESFIIVSNALDNLTPQHYDFSPLLQIDSNKRIVLLVDDSHGIGVVRKNKVSTELSMFDNTGIDVVVVASLAKGMGTDAGIILSSNKWIQRFRKSSFFTGASPASPAFMYAFTNSQEIYSDEFNKLQQNIKLLSDLIGNSLSHIPNFPVFSSTNPKLYQKLVQEGFLISSFPYPLETDPPLNRIVLSSLHNADDLKKIAAVICD